MLWMVVAPALAQNVAPPGERPVALGVGGFFNAGGTFMTQPPDRTIDGFAGELPYSGWGGFSPGGGVSLDFRVKDIVGIEVDFIRSIDQARSKYTVNNVDFPFEVKTPSWHIPIMLKLGIPSASVSPNLFIGVNNILPDKDIELETPAGLGWQLSAHSSSYQRLFFGIGFEGRLPIDGVDIRIPFSLRGSAAPSYPDSATDRATYDIGPGGLLIGMDYDLRWQYHAGIALGVAYYFL
ncbi:MAG: hypothetical protein R3F61_37835 [Myxococcota bacterium]